MTEELERLDVLAQKLSRQLDRPTDDPVTVADLLRLALLGEVTLFVRLPDVTMWYFDWDLFDELDDEVQIAILGIGRPLNIHRPVHVLHEKERQFSAGVWAVELERNGRRAIERWYLELIGNEVNAITEQEGGIVSADGLAWQLPYAPVNATRHDEGPQSVPYRGGRSLQVWPREAEFLMEESILESVPGALRVESDDRPSAPSGRHIRRKSLDRPTNDGGRRTLLKIILVLMEELKMPVDQPYKSAEALQAMGALMPQLTLPNLRMLGDYMDQVKRLKRDEIRTA